jgi:hypothetical protein
MWLFAGAPGTSEAFGIPLDLGACNCGGAGGDIVDSQVMSFPARHGSEIPSSWKMSGITMSHSHRYSYAQAQTRPSGAEG